MHTVRSPYLPGRTPKIAIARAISGPGGNETTEETPEHRSGTRRARMSNMLALQKVGQSMWLDYIDRNLLVDGALEALVDEGLSGVTSNPTIFHKAITSDSDYDDVIRDLMQADHEIDARTLFEWLSIQDAQLAADILKPVYDRSDGQDGYVSIEVSPHLAYDTIGTIEAARHLWRALRRPNVMIKVPATRQGLSAIERLIADGINVNATLLFSIDRYAEVFQAYIRGLAMNPQPAQVASVASFFVSRIDNKIDPMLEAIGSPEALAVRGKAAIACAKLAYARFKQLTEEEGWDQERRRGARVQRLLWGSTSTKNPAYSDVLYVESLIGPQTVNTVPPHTLDAFQAHGEVRRGTLEQDIERARRDIERLESLGIRLKRVTDDLEMEGVEAFAASYDALLGDLAGKRVSVTREYATHS
jgi:transaldolase